MDCVKGMRDLPDHSVDLVIADPPYNLSKGNHWCWDRSVQLEGLGGVWNKVMADWDNMELKEYFNFTYAWISEAKRVLKPTGSMWVYGTYHNIGIVNFIFQLLRIEIINEIIWYKRNSFPNLSGRRFTASHETLLWAHSGNGKRNYYFNYQYAKEVEFAEDLLKKKGKQMRTVWDVPNNKTKAELRFGAHPTQKPLRIAYRTLMTTSRVDDICLVPFCGSGTECVAAKILKRRFIAFETNKEYIETANKRIKHATEEQKDLFSGLGVYKDKKVNLIANEIAIREMMRKKNINSITELALKSDVSKPKIHQYLRGDNPLATTFVRLCKYLEIDPNEAITLNGEKSFSDL